MDPRRSLVIGSRTRRNVLKGKNIRKHDDGADNFADYWTDSGSESTFSDKSVDLSQTQKEPQSARTLRSGTKVKDKQDNFKYLNPVKAVKKSICDENVHSSPTKKQKLYVHHNSMQNVNNVSNSSVRSSVESEPCSISNSIQHPISNATFLHNSTENADISALPKIKKVKGSQILSSSILTSKDTNEEEYAQFRALKRLADSLRENVSPLSKERKRKVSYSLRSSRSRNLNENISTQLSGTDDNDIMKSTENTLSPLRKQNENRRQTFVKNKNVSDVASTSEINLLVNKALNERNTCIKHKKRVSSSVENPTGKIMKNSSQMTKTPAVYDEYDAKIFLMAHNFTDSLNVPEKESHSHNRNVDVSLPNTKNNGMNSFKEKFTTPSINSPTILRKKSYENRNNQNLTLNSSNILPKFTGKKGSKTISNINNVTNISAERNENTENFDNEEEKHVNKSNNINVSEIFSIENIKNATDASAEESESVQNLKNTNKIHVSKIPKKSRALKASKDDENIVTEKNNGITANFQDGKISGVNKKREKQKVSETFSKDNNSANEFLEAGRETTSVDTIRKNHSESCGNSSTVENNDQLEVPSKKNKKKNEITANFQDGKISRVNKKREKQKMSETFSKDNNSANEFLEAGRETISVDTIRKNHSESCGNSSTVENNDQLEVLSKKNKKKNERVTLVDEASVRRSARQKYPPLATWRNERILYRFEKGFINVVGIDKGTGEDVPMRQNKKKEIKKKRIKTKFSVHDAINKKNRRVTLVKRFDDVPWDRKDEARHYHVKRMFETTSSVTGFIEIEPNAEKPVQYIPNEDIYLTLLKGQIEVHLKKDVIVVDKNTMFVIPRSVTYSLKNVASDRALLAFCVSRFHYLEDNL